MKPADSFARGIHAGRFSIDTLLEQMVAHNASDLHLTVGSKPVLRLRGHLHRMETLPVLTAEDTRHLLYRITSTEQQKQLELNRQLDMSYSIPGVARFRVNLYSQRESLAGAFRLIPTELKTLEELMPQSLYGLCQKPRGRSSSRARRARASPRRSRR